MHHAADDNHLFPSLFPLPSAQSERFTKNLIPGHHPPITIFSLSCSQLPVPTDLRSLINQAAFPRLQWISSVSARLGAVLLRR